MIGRELSLTFAFVLAAASSALPQVTARCAAQEAVGFLGISGVACNCTIGSRDPDNWAFRTEPRITSLEMNTSAGKLLRIGDVITHVNGELITTRDGARALAGVKPGEAVVLTVRRNGETLKFAMTAAASCPGDARLGMYAPSLRAATAPRAYTTSPRARATPTRVAPAAAPRSRGSFGMGLMCSGSCYIWVENDGALHFSEPPEVYSVERGSTAEAAGIRRGDVITHVDGRSITSTEGGRALGTAKPGTTLQFTVRRGGSSRTVSLTAAQQAPGLAPELSKSSEALERAQQSLRELERTQQRRLQKIEEEVRRSKGSDEARVRELQREFLRQEQEHRRKLNDVRTELLRTESRLRAALADSGKACALSTPSARAGGARTLRYTGILGDSEIEVRGPTPVTVTETDEEVTISTGATLVKVKKSRK